jgi:hypothetical protein
VRTLLEDRRGISSTAIAALFSIAVVLIFMTYINDLGNDQNLFVMIMGFFKAIGVLPANFDPWEILNSPVGPMAAYIGAYICMLFAVISTFVCIKWPLQATSEFSAWRRRRREKDQKIRDEEAKRRKAEKLERGLDLDGLGILGPTEELSFAHRYKEYYAKQQARPDFERYTGARLHHEAEQFGEEILLKLGENEIQNQIRHYGINILDNTRFERIPDYTSERYILECKTGIENNFKTIWKEVWEDLTYQLRNRKERM